MEVYLKDINIGRCSGYIQNNAAGGSQLVFTDMDCQLTYDEINKWCILTNIGLPMWENISIYNRFNDRIKNIKRKGTQLGSFFIIFYIFP